MVLQSDSDTGYSFVEARHHRCSSETDRAGGLHLHHRSEARPEELDHPVRFEVVARTWPFAELA
jgi:hypothetical protein